MSNLVYNWYKLAESESELDFSQNGLAIVVAKEKKITLARFREPAFCLCL